MNFPEGLEPMLVPAPRIDPRPVAEPRQRRQLASRLVCPGTAQCGDGPVGVLRRGARLVRRFRLRLRACGRAVFACLACVLLLAACAGGPEAPPVGENTSSPAGPGATIFVTSNGWHSGLVLPRAAVPPARVPEAAAFPNARFLEFGWGDAEYFPAPEPTVGMTLRAGLLPTPAVLHVVPLWKGPRRVYPKAEVIAVTLDGGQLDRLAAFIGASFDRSAGGARPGLYAHSRFYPAKGRFHLGNTCNSWIARALAAAGLAVDVTDAARAADLLSQVRRLGEKVLKVLN